MMACFYIHTKAFSFISHDFQVHHKSPLWGWKLWPSRPPANKIMTTSQNAAHSCIPWCNLWRIAPWVPRRHIYTHRIETCDTQEWLLPLAHLRCSSHKVQTEECLYIIWARVLCGARAIYISAAPSMRRRGQGVPGRRWVWRWVGGSAAGVSLSWGGVRHAQRSSVSLADRRDKRLAHISRFIMRAAGHSLSWTCAGRPQTHSEEATFD